MREEQTVTVETVFRLVGPGVDPARDAVDPGVPVPVELGYTGADPFAVHLTFITGPGHEVRWVFARGLLVDGLLAPVGEGDVRVWPEPDTARDVVVVELSSPSGYARFEVSASTVADFLDATFRAVPPGRESVLIKVDAALAALLATDRP